MGVRGRLRTLLCTKDTKEDLKEVSQQIKAFQEENTARSEAEIHGCSTLSGRKEGAVDCMYLRSCCDEFVFFSE